MKKILLADDDRIISAAIADFLRMSDRYEVFLAGDGEEAIKIASQEKFDLAIVDIRMPKKDGFEVCQVLKQNPVTAGIKVILVSGLLPESSVQKAIEVGADGYIMKPFGPGELLEKINEFFG